MAKPRNHSKSTSKSKPPPKRGRPSAQKPTRTAATNKAAAKKAKAPAKKAAATPKKSAKPKTTPPESPTKSKPVKVVAESETGRNELFEVGGQEVSRAQLVAQIEAGLHPDLHVRTINGVKTPVSNPDGSERNNLG